MLAFGVHLSNSCILFVICFFQADVRVSAGILRRITDGKQISRRERNFIVQTGVDLARLVPFSLFLIIPAAEFALPFALRVSSIVPRRIALALFVTC